ncbi:hypothetical protein DPMN_192913 [Dreissena polymorpha]|uniref:Uncharacterized protein n=1 Tax=Dreissena polymorpha TaxID=45954 RepID=A0A9D3Y377_DREPO|nr:hypothetical protein DPMN_192913 [Dreissena polymorpha]
MSQPTADSPTIIFQPGPFLLGGYLQATTSATMSNCAKELERHLCDKAVPLSQSPFLWWKLNMDTSPQLGSSCEKIDRCASNFRIIRASVFRS